MNGPKFSEESVCWDLDKGLLTSASQGASIHLTHSTSCHLNPDHLTCPKFKYNKKVGYSEAMNTKHLKCQYMQTVSSIGLVCRTESYDKNCYTLSQGLVG